MLSQVDIDDVKRELRGGRPVFRHRATGKTEALMQIIHEDYHGEATLFCVNARVAEIMRDRYRANYPNDPVWPTFAYRPEQVRGRKAPILVDDWFEIGPEIGGRLMATGRVVARVGT